MKVVLSSTFRLALLFLTLPSFSALFVGEEFLIASSKLWAENCFSFRLAVNAEKILFFLPLGKLASGHLSTFTFSKFVSKNYRKYMYIETEIVDNNVGTQKGNAK